VLKRSPGRAFGAALLSALVALAASPAARADGLADEAELHFQRGADLYRHGDFAGALEHLMLSNRLVANRNVVYNIARAFEQLRRFADAHRYYVDALAGETDAQAIKDATAAIARIAPEVAVVRVTTEPPGATIYIDRKDLGSRGLAPRALALAPGKYRVLAERDGYDPIVSEIIEARLGAEIIVPLTLRRIVGTVHVEVEGGGAAAVHVDDPAAPSVCAAPCDVELAPGRHDLHFTRDGFQTATRLVTVLARRTVRASATLSPLTGSILVSTEERGALVTVDGRAAGFTPTVIQGVPAGTRKLRIALRGFAPLDLAPSVVVGQQTALENLELHPVREVTAVSRYAEKIDDAPSSVSILDGQELRAFGYPTIAESLKGLRGVSISNDRVYASAGIRGIGLPNDYGNRFLVLSDGQALNDNLLNSSYIGSDGRVDLHDVDRIEVVRGPGSLLYGTGAFSGVVNLVTRPRDEPNSVHAGVGAYDDSVLHGRAGFHYNLSPTAGVWASASAAHSQGVTIDLPSADPGNDSGTRPVHKVDAFNSGGTAGRAWIGAFTAQWFYHRRQEVSPVGAYGTVIDNPRTQFTDTRMMTELRFEPHLSETVQLMTRAHANRYVYHGNYRFNDGANVEDFAGTWFGGEARLIYTPSARLRVTGGGEGQLHPEATLLGVNGKDDGATTAYLNEKTPYSFGAAYAIVEASPLPWLRISGGARVDVYSTFGPIVVPRAAVILKPTAGGALKIMGGRAFRAPSIYEQDYNDNGMTQARAVDPARHLTLGPESIYSLEVEYSQRFRDDWIALGAVHASYLQGIIDSLPDDASKPDSPVIRYANSPPALAIGGDVELRREWRRGAMLAVTYCYQRARLLEGTGNTRLPNAPEHLASFRGVVPVVRDLASLGARIRLEAPRQLQNSDVTTSTAAVIDATLSGALRDYGIRYVIGVYNITDWTFRVPVTETFASRTMPQNGRTFLIDLLATFP
jgi:outer membrane receptor for ferrienterochelin and colicin